MEQAADKETCSMEYKKGWEEEEYVVSFCQRELSMAGRWFQRARTEGSFRAGILNHVWNAERFEMKPAIRTNTK